MIRLYQGSGSGEIELLGQPLPPEDWRRLRENVIRLLKARKAQLASELLASIKPDPVSWDTELARMTVTKEAGHGDEAEDAGVSAGAIESTERD